MPFSDYAILSLLPFLNNLMCLVVFGGGDHACESAVGNLTSYNSDKLILKQSIIVPRNVVFAITSFQELASKNLRHPLLS